MAWFNPFLRPGNIKRNFHGSEIDFSSIKQVKINRNATETILLFYYFFLRLLALKTIKQNFTFIYHFHANAFQLQKIIKQELYITCVSDRSKASGLSRRVYFQFLLHFPRRATLFFLKRDEIVQWPRSQPYWQERGVFDMTVVFAENKEKSASGRHFVWFCDICDFPVTLREVLTSRNLPGKLPGKLTGSKITGVSRNTRNIYRVVTGWLYGPDRLPGLSRNGPQVHSSHRFRCFSASL